MSFILDALKKSENERQRQSGPALFEVKVAPPRSHFALWGTLIAVLLAVNLIVITWVLSHGSRGSAAGSPADAPSALATRAPQVTVTPTPSAAVASSGVATPAGTPPAASSTPPTTAGTTTALIGSAEAAGASSDSDDDAPAVDTPRAAVTSPPALERATDSGLPTYQDAAAVPGAGIPELKMQLHSYDDTPANRFVFINGVQLQEGGESPQGVRVEKITADGVILSYHGNRFVLLQ